MYIPIYITLINSTVILEVTSDISQLVLLLMESAMKKGKKWIEKWINEIVTKKRAREELKRKWDWIIKPKKENKE